MKKRLFIAGIAIAIIGVAIFAFIQHGKTETSGTKIEIQISASGFSPSAIVVKPGTQIIWKNVDEAPHAVASNPYPSSSSLKDLRSQTILPKGSYSYIAHKKGVINYHDSTQPTHNATITVKE